MAKSPQLRAEGGNVDRVASAERNLKASMIKETSGICLPRLLRGILTWTLGVEYVVLGSRRMDCIARLGVG
jgi:hypothetical protein